MRLNKTAVFYKACLIPLMIAFFKIFNQLTGVFGTFEAIRPLLFFDTVHYFAFAAMLRLPLIAVQAACAWIFMITVFITNLAIHSARSKHGRINIFIGHLHH